MSDAKSNAATHRNNFDAIRLIAALIVLVFHAWPLGGWGSAPRMMGWPVYTVAVFVFFAVSGQLITQSWFRDPRVIPYVVRRAGRIFPALAVVVVATIFVIGPLFSSLTTTRYFSDTSTWQYLWNLLLIAQYPLPGVFIDNPSDAVNGSLWSLGPEVACYLGVMLIGALAFRLSTPWRTASTVLIGASLLIGCVATAGDGSLRALNITFTAMMMFFVGGVYERWGVRRSHALAGCLVVALMIVGLVGDEWVGRALLVVALPYLTRYVGGGSTPLLRDAARFGDYSYGIYLWGFLILQAVIATVPAGQPWLVLICAVPLTLLAAGTSWWVVERPMMALARNRSAKRVPSFALVGT
ncbi:acyltransferase [Microbacterium sp. ISL-59]|uniref:acyltransferase family protein n=1 Tax=Microbacterium sp. ISL-59 TaxID=2819159 RepID=UPI001BEA1664|nr:acyltransferase [Microbacterium sp. ISL-59]MBT2496706.1 acyltransferase [Microbacterium sp. ISL-59]